METAFHTSSCSRFSGGQALELAARSGYRRVEVAADISESRHFEAHRAGVREAAGFAGMLRSLDLRLAAIDIGGWDAPLCIASAASGRGNGWSSCSGKGSRPWRRIRRRRPSPGRCSSSLRGWSSS